MFYLYQIQDLDADHEKWTFIRNVKLAGPAGPLAQYIGKLPYQEAEGWAVPGSALASLVTAGVGAYALLYDPDPNNSKYVTLDLLAKVAGNSRDDRSDVLLVFEQIWSAHPTDNPQEFKKSFSIEKHTTRREHSEAITITGGTDAARSTWKLTKPTINLGTAVLGG
jgi:hypothetical protein